jgi:AAA+ superfamily predicted ATPase
MTNPVDHDDLIHSSLLLPTTVIAYHVSARLHDQFAGKAMLEGEIGPLDIEEYAAAGLCTLRQLDRPYGQRLSHWLGPGNGVGDRGHNVWYEITWEDHTIDALLMSWPSPSHGEDSHTYLLADERDVLVRFVDAVCTWNTELRDEVLVFESGHWHKDEALFWSIKNATLDNLVLRGSLKEDIHSDLAGFFANRETYEAYGVPWKRGILFLGPPGNGKTHAVKALVNALGQDCLYVKSFRSQAPDEFNIRNVFHRARESAPCILVLEDLDSLVTSRNRSFFLNELDGFAGNDGILTLATTNHPERLDPAIIDRPSRFDRKYPFDLPAAEERARYIAMWNQTLRPELRLPNEALPDIAERTEDFSFAYLKELFISATMRWINAPEPGTMARVMIEQADVLKAQMASAIMLDGGEEEGDESMDDGAFRVMHHTIRGRRRGGFGVRSYWSSEP